MSPHRPGRMDKKTNGYIRLLKDLWTFKEPEDLSISLARARVSIDELERLIVRLEQLGHDHKSSKP